MLALRDRKAPWASTVADSDYRPEAVDAVRAALALRIDLDLFADPADIDLIIKMSGGCIRDLLHLVTLAFSYSGDDEQFTSAAVLRAIREMRATYIRRLTPEDYTALAAIALRQPAPAREDADPAEGRARINRLLFHRFALEYLDDDDSPWNDVHPLVIETEDFQSAVNAS